MLHHVGFPNQNAQDVWNVQSFKLTCPPGQAPFVNHVTFALANLDTANQRDFIGITPDTSFIRLHNLAGDGLNAEFQQHDWIAAWIIEHIQTTAVGTQVHDLIKQIWVSSVVPIDLHLCLFSTNLDNQQVKTTVSWDRVSMRDVDLAVITRQYGGFVIPTGAR